MTIDSIAEWLVSAAIVALGFVLLGVYVVLVPPLVHLIGCATVMFVLGVGLTRFLVFGGGSDDDDDARPRMV